MQLQTKKTLDLAEGEGRGQALAAQTMREQREKSQADSYELGYEHGAAAAHPLVSVAVGMVCGIVATLLFQSLASRVVAFFS